MGIRVLSEDTAAKIAAGEVIIRPASAVKELVENALDAGASKIEVYIEQGGKKLVKVADNGEGIASDEVELAVQRFATSKLASADDLRKISSYGFRGEALGSMAEVSDVVIESQQKDEESGIMLKVKAGKIVDKKEIVRSPGTTVWVRDLFFNLPARRAFLKGDAYERRLVLGVLKDYALIEPRVFIEVKNQQRTLMSFPPDENLKNRALKVFKELKNVEIIEFSQSHPMLSVEGLLVRPDQAQELGRKQKTFFNGRPVLYRSAYRAVMEGFGPQPGKQAPFFILKLTAPAEMLDANIHPAKTEVRYRDERFLFDFITQTVRKVVLKEAAANLAELKTAPHKTAPHKTAPQKYPGSVQDDNLPAQDTATLTIPLDASSHNSFSPPPSESASVYAPHEVTQPSTGDSPAFQKSFWQLQGVYIMAQTSSGLIIVDQHAAHERILYEEMLSKLGNMPRQSLLFPMIVDLSAEEFAVFEEIADALRELGMEVKPFGPSQVIIETLPADARMGPADLRTLFREFAETSEVKLGNRDKMAALIACRAAIKAGRNLSQQEMESLINRLFSCNTPYFCPHGRPTVIKFTMDDLDKRFGRF